MTSSEKFLKINDRVFVNLLTVDSVKLQLYEEMESDDPYRERYSGRWFVHTSAGPSYEIDSEDNFKHIIQMIGYSTDQEDTHWAFAARRPHK